jgi:IMP dehydrogenase
MPTPVESFLAQFPHEGLTFDDVSLSVGYADFLPEDTCVKTSFSRNITLNLPFVSAAMDTVTESRMAIAMAMCGGIGVIHKNLSADDQAGQVRHVKGYLNGLIEHPVVFRRDILVAELIAEKERRKYNFAGFPIVDADGRLCGIITARDLKFLHDHSVPVAEAMTADPVTAPVGTTLAQAYTTMVAERIGKLPIVDDDNRLVGLYSFHDVKSLSGGLEPDINRDRSHRLRVAAAIGPYEDERIEKLITAGVDALIVDTAHGHTKGVIDTVRDIKKQTADVDVVAGNVGDGAGARALLDAGVDGVKVGIGPGSICTTRIVAGVGVPQLTAVHGAWQEVGAEVPIIADGGIKQSGDVPKAMAVGAHAVMMGSALAGTQESTGEKILHQGRRYVVYRGMGSLEAMAEGRGSRERYSHPEVDRTSDLVPQGIEGLVQYSGTVDSVLRQYTGGLRFALGYCGARTLDELRRKAQFVRISSAGLRESHAHDVKIIKDAPNYSSDLT